MVFDFSSFYQFKFIKRKPFPSPSPPQGRKNVFKGYQILVLSIISPPRLSRVCCAMERPAVNDGDKAGTPTRRSRACPHLVLALLLRIVSLPPNTSNVYAMSVGKIFF